MDILLSFPSFFGTLPLCLFCRRRRCHFRRLCTLCYFLCVSLGNRNNKLFGVLYKQFHLNFMLSACFLNNLPAIQEFKVRSPKKCAFLMRNLFLFCPAFHLGVAFSSFVQFISSLPIIVQLLFLFLFLLCFVDCVSSAVYRLCIAFFHFFSFIHFNSISFSLSLSSGTLCYH